MNRWKNSLVGTLGVAACLGGCVSQPDARDPVDLVVAGDWVLTLAPDEAPIPSGAVAIANGEIVAVGPAAEIDRRYRAANRIDGTDRVVMPGLVNGHTHAAMSLLRGVADDLELMAWLTGYIFPAEVALVDEDFVRTGTQLACWEMIRGGITSFVDMYYFPDAVAETVVDCGLRAVVAPSVIEQRAPDAPDGATSLAQARSFASRWRERHPRIVPAIGAHSVYTVSRDGLERIVAATRAANVPLAIHVAESANEMAASQAQHGMSPVAVLEDIGAFSGPVIAAHMVHPDANDVATLARRRVGVVHNPTSNLKLASGVAPVTQMRAAGVPVGLGTDGAASNNDLDLWEEIRLAGLLAKNHTLDPTVLPAREALAMATRSGAHAAGLGDDVGMLAAGLRADLIQVRIDAMRHRPLYDIESHLVYVADATDVSTTIVEGVVLMRDEEVLSIDGKRLATEVAAWRQRIAGELGLDIAPPARNEVP